MWSFHVGVSYAIVLDEIDSCVSTILALGCCKHKESICTSADLCKDLGIDGDDFSMLTEEFASKFKVDMSNYYWYFHHGEESRNIFMGFFPPPDRQVNHIPVTPQILQQAATAGKWLIEYPPHSIRSRAFEMVLNYSVVAVILLLLVVLLIYKIA
jgi:hypothetical protein